jgi:hypothetical protein
MEFFKELESINSVKMSGLKAGKAAEQAEFDNLLRDVEKDLDQAAAQAPRRRSEDEVLAVAEDGPADPSMASASGESAPGTCSTCSSLRICILSLMRRLTTSLR